MEIWEALHSSGDTSIPFFLFLVIPRGHCSTNTATVIATRHTASTSLDSSSRATFATAYPKLYSQKSYVTRPTKRGQRYERQSTTSPTTIKKTYINRFIETKLIGIGYFTFSSRAKNLCHDPDYRERGWCQSQLNERRSYIVSTLHDNRANVFVDSSTASRVHLWAVEGKLWFMRPTCCRLTKENCGRNELWWVAA